MTTGQQDGKPTGYLARNAEEGKERENAFIAGQKLIGQIDRVLAIRNDQGGAGRFASEAAHGIYDTKAANELAVLESEMTTTGAVAAHLGALSESDRGLMNAKYRNLNSVGSGAEERLVELRRITQAALDNEKSAAGGPRATKAIGANGREQVEVAGGFNTPNNPRTTERRPAKP